MHEVLIVQSTQPPRSPFLEQLVTGRLTWWPQLGIGYYPVTVGIEPYDAEYFARFDRDAHAPIGRALMIARCDFVDAHYRGSLVDVGIGSGAFVERRQAEGKSTYGYDVNPAGIAWLDERRIFLNPYRVPVKAMTLWDVLEHIPDFQALLANVQQWLFLSLPIFRDAEHVLLSKHYRPTEHVWHFTQPGLVYAMKQCGFELVSESNVETELGREDIGTFAFKRVI
jgi:hypothetical protein